MNIVEWAFGKRMTPAERLRKHQRSLEKTNENSTVKGAKNGQMGACKIQAKDLVRTRRYIEKFYSMRTQLQAISLRIQVHTAFQSLVAAADNRARLFGRTADDAGDERCNRSFRQHERSMNLPALQRIAMEFERENDIMDQRQEMMDDAIDDVTGLEDEADGEEIVEQVLEEIGVDLRQAMGETPQGLQNNVISEGRIAQPVGAGGGGDPGDDDLQARLDSF
ncbi:putative vacuolar-protein sorting-associated protein [Bisporella sp. PMI_857]|nr:putative vacuolar-protein sorting-associated protein [Bisporella sp. PMI_857]